MYICRFIHTVRGFSLYVYSSILLDGYIHECVDKLTITHTRIILYIIRHYIIYTHIIYILLCVYIGMDDILAPLRLKLVEYIRTNIVFRGCFSD